MPKVSATEFSRSLSKFLDAAEFRGEGVTIVRNRQAIARLVSGPARMTALEAFGDLYRTLPEQDKSPEKDESPDAVAPRLEQRLAALRDPWLAEDIEGDDQEA